MAEVVDKQFYTLNGFGFLHSQQRGFLQTYIECDGDLAATAEGMKRCFCTEQELALAAVAYGGPESWFADFPRVADLKAMLVDHVNGLLGAIIPQHIPYLLGRDAATSTVLMAWSFCLAYAGFEDSMRAVCAMCVAFDRQIGGPGEAAKTARDALRLPTLVRSFDVAARAFGGACKKLMAVRNEYVACAARVYQAVHAAEPDEDYIDLSVTAWGDIMSRENSARVMEVYEAVHRLDGELYEEIKERGVEVLSWMKTARGCSQAKQAIVDEAAATNHDLLQRMLMSAVDNLPPDELRPWVYLADAINEKANVHVDWDLHAALDCETMRERRNLPWRQQVEESDIQALLILLHREHVERSLVVAELCTGDEQQQQQQKKKKKKKKPHKPHKPRPPSHASEEEAVEAAAAAIAVAVDSLDDNDCVVCMEQPAALRNSACGHTVMCERCATDWLSRSCECPMCRAPWVCF